MSVFNKELSKVKFSSEVIYNERFVPFFSENCQYGLTNDMIDYIFQNFGQDFVAWCFENGKFIHSDASRNKLFCCVATDVYVEVYHYRLTKLMKPAF